MNNDQSISSQVVGGSSSHTMNIHLDSPQYASICPQGPSFVAPGPSYMMSAPFLPSYHDWYEPLPSPPRPPLPPMPDETAPFYLSKITRNTLQCTGYGNEYCKPLAPSYDLCVQHREWQTFSSPSGGPQSKFSLAYYHVHLPYITRNWPFFTPRDLVISPEIWSKLTTVHQEFLASLGTIHDSNWVDY